MLLDLIVAEFEDLQFVRERALSRLGFRKVVDNLAVRERLLDVLVVEVDDCVAVRERFPLDSVVEDDLFFAVLVNALDFSILADVLLSYFLIRRRLVMVFFGVLKTVIFLLLLLFQLLFSTGLAFDGAQIGIFASS